MADTEDYSKMKVADLKKACKDKGLAVSGTKADLTARLSKANSSSLGSGLSGDSDHEHDDSLLNDEDEDLLKVLDKTEDDHDLNLDATLDKSDEHIEKETLSPSKLTEEPISPTTAKKISLGGLKTDSEKLAARAAKFGAVSEEAKKQIRAAKFGIETTETKTTTEDSTKPVSGSNKGSVSVTSLEDIERLKKRGERFGDSVSPAMKQLSEKEKQLKRLERFGGTTSENNFTKKQVKLVDESKKDERLKRFGDTASDNVTSSVTSSTPTAFDEKRRKRAERFGAVPVVSADLDERKKKRLERFQ